VTEADQEKISFHTTDIDILPVEGLESAYEKWLLQVALNERKSIEHISYIFCSDEYLLDMNRRYLQHDYYTDIITFPYQQGDVLESDIFISVDRVRENARLFAIPFEEELRRVMVHGLLHLAGYDDHADEKTTEMRQKEEEYMRTFSDFLQ
jgi:rRNA maturation RNase YbeY